MENKRKVHFMGICGSGAAPIAIIPKDMGFDVSGCDLNVSGYYKNALIENNIEVLKGHDLSHIDDIDILAISPAILDISPNHPEIMKLLLTCVRMSKFCYPNMKFRALLI